MIYYSISENTCYEMEVFEYVLPDDAIEISTEKKEEIHQAIAVGKKIIIDNNIPIILTEIDNVPEYNPLFETLSEIDPIIDESLGTLTKQYTLHVKEFLIIKQDIDLLIENKKKERLFGGTTWTNSLGTIFGVLTSPTTMVMANAEYSSVLDNDRLDGDIWEFTDITDGSSDPQSLSNIEIVEVIKQIKSHCKLVYDIAKVYKIDIRSTTTVDELRILYDSFILQEWPETLTDILNMNNL